MSMHEIEDLVEDSVRMVLASDRPRADKLATIGDLYGVQGWFDTGDTTGRLADELDAIGYVDAGPRRPVALLRLAADMMEAGDAAGLVEISQGWLALALTAITDLDLTDQIPATFEAMLAQGDGPRMRALALKGGLHTRWRKDFFMRVPSWGSNRTLFARLDPERLERRFILRYLSDAKADEATIRADYAAEKAKIEGLATLPLFSLPERVPKLAPLVYLGLEIRGQYRSFVFADSAKPPARDGSRVFVVVEHSNDLNMLALEVRVQSGLLLAWQGNDDGDRIAATHFRLNTAMLAPEREMDADKEYHPVGGWPFRLDQSARTLDRKLAAIFGHWKHVERVRKFHRTPLDRLLAESTPEAMEKKRRDLRGKYGFFLNDIELLFAYACLGWERSGRPDAVIARIEDELRFVVDLYPLKPAWREGLRLLRDGPWFPPATEKFPYRRLETPLPAVRAPAAN